MWFNPRIVAHNQLGYLGIGLLGFEEKNKNKIIVPLWQKKKRLNKYGKKK